MIFDGPIDIDAIQSYYNNMTDSDTTNDYSYDNMILNLGYGKDLYMYYFDYNN